LIHYFHYLKQIWSRYDAISVPVKEIESFFGEYLDEEQIDKMIKEIDNDGDGFISFEDFVNAMSNQ